jgi:glycosyltransferase involved in cell wall biosynthesis
MSSYKVSVIVSCFNILTLDNNLEYFNNLLYSIKNQTIGFENIELFLIDDCSEDNTLKILNNIAQDYENIMVFQTEYNSGGPAMPRNLGLVNATSNYVIFLDCDDYLDFRAIEMMYSTISEYNLDIVKVNQYVLMNDVITKRVEYPFSTIFISPKSKELKYLSLNVWDAIYNKQFLSENNLIFEHSRCEDFVFSIGCYVNTTKDICFLNRYYGVVYNVDNSKSITHEKRDILRLKSLLPYLDICIQSLSENNVDSSYLEYCATNLRICALFDYYLATSSFEDNYLMFDELCNFLKKYSEIKFVKINNVSYSHFFFWKTVNSLIVNNKKDFVKFIFKFMNLFTK